MVKYLSTFLYELDWYNDLTRPINAISQRQYGISRLSNSLKSFIRGAVVGGLIGLVSGLLSDSDLGSSMNTGAQIGALIDTVQYNVRHTILTVRYSDWYKSLP